MSQYYAIITDVGNAKISNALALGKTISLTHMAVGDANGNNFSPTPEQKKLVNEKFRAQINSLSIDDENQNVVIAELIIPEDIGGFYVRELGVFDNEGNLIAIGNTPESYKPKMSEGSGAQKVMRMHLATSASDKIELKINPSIVVATIDLVNLKVAEINKTIATKSDKTHNHDTVYAKITHTHTTAQVTGLDTALAGKASTSHGHADLVPMTRKVNGKALSADVSLTASDVGAASATHNHDTVYAKTTHTHTTAQVTGLDTALAGKASTSHGHADLVPTTRKINNKALSADIALTATDVGAAEKAHGHSEYALTSHGHTIANVSGLQTALDGKSPTSHGHSNLANTNASNIVVADYLNKLGLKEASLQQNGWQKLPSGLIIQWGSVEVARDSAKAVSYPIKFPTSGLSISVCSTLYAISVGGAAISAPTVQYFNEFGFQILNDNDGNLHFWIAIGH